MSAFRIITGWILIFMFFFAAVWLNPGGLANFRFFLYSEPIMFVFIMTLIWGWMTFGMKAIVRAMLVGIRQDPQEDSAKILQAKTILSGLRNACLMFGVIGTVFGLILMIGTIEDVSRVPYRMAVALVSTFYGLFFSEVVFGSLVSRLTKEGETVQSQKGFILSSLFLVVIVFFSILYALSSRALP